MNPFEEAQHFIVHSTCGQRVMCVGNRREGLQFCKGMFQVSSTACCRGLDTVALQILDEWGADACKLDQVNRCDGDTALILAYWKGLDAVALKMLEFGADACKLGLVNSSGHCARTYAMDHGASMRSVVDAMDDLLPARLRTPCDIQTTIRNRTKTMQPCLEGSHNPHNPYDCYR